MGREQAEPDAVRGDMQRRYRQKAMNFTGTYTEAQEALREFWEKVMNGDIVTRSSWTYDENAKHYVDTRLAAGEIEKRSADSIRAQLHQLGYLIGGLNMQEITTEIIEAAYTDLRAGKSRSGRKLTGTTLNVINKAVCLMFADAKEKGIIGSNPMDKVARPRRDTKERGGEWPAGTVELDGKHYELKPDYPLAADQYGVRPLPRSLTAWWVGHRTNFGMDGWSLHELRHSFLTRAAASDVHPAVMQKLAGHSSSRVTMEIYTHVNIDAKREAMELMQMEFM